VPDQVRELLLTETAVENLGARGISATELDQLLHNEHVTVRNPHAPTRTRRLLISRTNGGRCLTIVMEQTIDPTSWLLVTGWESTDTERNLLNAQS
jgi:hypothetical protein